MSMNLFDLVVSIGSDDSGLKSGIAGAKSAGEGLTAATAAMGNLMADAFEMVIGKVVEYGQAVVQVGVEQESALAKVNTIMDTSVMNTQEMSDAIRELSSDMAVSVPELADTVYNAISATGDTANAVALAEQASKLATAGFTDTGSALSVLTTSMNAYGLSADEASHISDSLMTVQNKGVTTVAELSATMGKAIASASAYGVDLENLESAYINITKAGINTAEGTTYISSMFKELGDNGSKISGILQEETGKSFDQLMADGMSLGDVLGVLQESVDGDSTALMNLWGSAEAGKAANAIISQGLEEFNQNLDELKTGAGATEEAYATMSDTFQHKTEQMKTMGENLMATIFEGLSGDAGGLADFGIEALQSLTDGFNEGGLEGMLSVGMDLVGGLIEQAIEALPEYLDMAIQGVNDFITSVFSGFDMQAVFDSGMQIIEVLMDAVSENGPKMIDGATKLISDFAGGLSETLPELIPAGVEMIMTLVTSLIDNAPQIFESAIAIISALVQGLLNSLPTLLAQAPIIIMKLATALFEMKATLIQAGWDMLVNLVEGVVEGIPELVKKAPEIIEKWVDEFKKQNAKVKNIGDNLVKGIWEGISAGYEWIKTKLSEWAGNVLSYLKELFGIKSPSRVMRDEVGKYLGEGVVEGFIQDDPLGRIQSDIDSWAGRLGSYEMPLMVKADVAQEQRMDNLQAAIDNLAASLETMGVSVVLEGDAKGLFKAVRNQNELHKRITGRSALA